MHGRIRKADLINKEGRKYNKDGRKADLHRQIAYVNFDLPYSLGSPYGNYGY